MNLNPITRSLIRVLEYKSFIMIDVRYVERYTWLNVVGVLEHSIHYSWIKMSTLLRLSKGFSASFTISVPYLGSQGIKLQ